MSTGTGIAPRHICTGTGLSLALSHGQSTECSRSSSSAAQQSSRPCTGTPREYSRGLSMLARASTHKPARSAFSVRRGSRALAGRARRYAARHRKACPALVAPPATAQRSADNVTCRAAPTRRTRQANTHRGARSRAGHSVRRARHEPRRADQVLAGLRLPAPQLRHRRHHRRTRAGTARRHGSSRLAAPSVRASAVVTTASVGTRR